MDRKISELVKASEINNEDVLPVVQNGMTKKIPWENIKELKIGSAQPTKNEQVWFRKGKNELDTTNLIAQTFNGVTVSRNSDGTITLNGSVTGSGTVLLLRMINKKIQGTNTFSARIVSGTLTGGTIRISVNDDTATSATSTTARIFSTTLNDSTSINSNTVENLDKKMFYLAIYINSGITFTNCKIALQIEAGSSYSDYENFVVNDIYVKNDNNTFSNFSNNIRTKIGVATTNAGGQFNTYISRNYDILSATVMKTAGTNFTRAEVYARNDQANQVAYVYDVSGNAVANTEVEYRIKYIEN